MFKSLVKSRLGGFFLSRLIAGYVWLVRHTVRLQIIGHEKGRDGTGHVIAFWHGRLVTAMVFAPHAPAPFHMLTSTHRDGDIIINGVKIPNLHFIRGSAANPKKRFKNKNGVPAALQMLQRLGAGDFVGITPDGPRGPAFEAQPGVVRLARQAQAPILPIGFAVQPAITLESWDKGQLPLPFARVVAWVGDPLTIAPTPAGTSPTEDCTRLTQAINLVTAHADNHLTGGAPAPQNANPAAPTHTD
ncbi:MAG: lysophospholipid acyltransferase family protein [Pseudomonadota bacterium]